MKFIHLSDLHIGKRLYEYSLLEDQKYILEEILKITEQEKPDAAFLAGDIYDKSIPGADAVAVFDDFLVRLSALVPEVFLVSGNHDSAARVAFGGRLMEKSGVHISPAYDGEIAPVPVQDSFGTVNIYLLPYIKPGQVKQLYPEEEILSFADAVRLAIKNMHINPKERNILVTHLCVTGSIRSESEEIYIGGVEDVPESLFSNFAYTALGHIHRPQSCSPRVRYCGTPLKYSFSEAKDEKSVTVGELDGEGGLTLRTVPLIPLRDMVELRGSYEEVTARSFYENTSWQEDYTRIILTDEEDIPDVAGRLSVIYHYFTRVAYDNTRTRSEGFDFSAGADLTDRSPLDLYADLYRQQNGQEMDAEQEKIIIDMLKKIQEESV